MAKLSVDRVLLKAKSCTKKGDFEEAQKLYQSVLQAFPKNTRAQKGLAALNKPKQPATTLGSPQEIINQLVNLYNQGQLVVAVEQAQALTEQYPDAYFPWNILGAAHKGLGNIFEASDAFKKVTELKPNYADGHNNLGASLKDLGKFDEAIVSYNKALSLKPDYAEAYNNLGAVLQDQGKFEEALTSYNKALSLKPDYADAFYNMGIVLQEQGKLEEAIKAYTKTLSLKPDYAETHYNMGNAHKEQGMLEEAIKAYNKALSLKPDYAEAYINIGNALQDQGNLEEAITSYNKALSLKPDYAEAYINMGNALQDQGKFEEAITSYNKALSLKPDYAEAYNNMGAALQDQGKFEEAITSYNKALAIKPDHAEAWSNGAEALEKWNKLKELGLWLERAFQILEPIPSDISFMKSKLLWRNKDTQEAIKLILNIDVETLKPNRQQDYFNLKAKCYEVSKDYDLAFNCFENMNLLTIKSDDYLKLEPESYFQNIKKQLEILKSNSLENPAKFTTKQSDFVPVFLVGFPRSGTTLLDTILRSHSSIDVVEEQPTVESAIAFIQKSGHSKIEALPQEVLSGAKKAYITELDKHRQLEYSKPILIDKLPLNLLHIPLIQQLYPQAKFILALRHPLDTILSCWMQNFNLNSAMANMVALDRIVEFYCVAMETFKICRVRYNLNVHQIKYEDLLEDLSGETSALLKFLDLDWEAQMENYQETALKRGRINTPSYSQVVQPIYKEAKYRWLNYEKHLRQYVAEVEPWIGEYNYSKR
jgi:tetratricopeptide (TPR) repeat protein